MFFHTVTLVWNFRISDETKNKFILEATINYVRNSDFLDPFFNNAFIIMKNVHLYTKSKSPKSPIFFLFLLTF